VTERDGGQPVDADMNVFGRFLAAGDIEVAAARRAGADEDRVVVLGKKFFQAVDALAATKLDAEIEDVAGFGISGSACASCRRPADRRHRRRIHSRAAQGRARL